MVNNLVRKTNDKVTNKFIAVNYGKCFERNAKMENNKAHPSQIK